LTSEAILKFTEMNFLNIYLGEKKREIFNHIILTPIYPGESHFYPEIMSFSCHSSFSLVCAIVLGIKESPSKNCYTEKNFDVGQM
jgi:hypothetical protein